MIAYIKGTVQYADPTYVVIDVGGVGYQCFISLNTFSALKGQKEIQLHTHLHIKEDAHTLYGFYDVAEKRRFLDLIGISGVGPATALMTLGSLTAQELQTAVLSEDVKTIQRVKGIGGKTAQRIILELKDKFKKEGLAPLPGQQAAGAHNTLRHEALQALTTLGIPKASAEKAVTAILKNTQGEITVEDLIKQALKTA